MRVIDINTMLGPWPHQKLEFETAEQLVKKMDRYGIETAWAYSSYAVKISPLDGNYMLMDQLKGYEDRIKPCWVIVPTWDMECDGSLEKELKENDVRMVRMLPAEHNFSLDPWVCADVYGMLSKNSIPLMLEHANAPAAQIHAVCQAFPELKVILAQCEFFQNRNLYMLMKQHQNLFLEISTYYVYSGVEDLVHRFGSQRILFGSHMPFQEGAAPLGMTLLADLMENEKEDILYRNAERLMREVRQ